MRPNILETIDCEEQCHLSPLRKPDDHCGKLDAVRVMITVAEDLGFSFLIGMVMITLYSTVTKKLSIFVQICDCISTQIILTGIFETEK